MTFFRPCIDIHEGRVKQIVGGSLKDDGSKPTTNFISEHSPDWFAKLYQKDDVRGGHVILLGQGNQQAALAALGAWPGGLQVGGGITPENANSYLEAGASHVIVTSWIFSGAQLDMAKVRELSAQVKPSRLVLDLSCRRTPQGWSIATNRWQTVTASQVNAALLESIGQYCAEFLVHAADVEGLQAGMDEELIQFLGVASPIPVTYAGGAKSIADLEKTEELSQGKVDLTIGSALDIFGGKGARYEDCVRFNRIRPKGHQ